MKIDLVVVKESRYYLKWLLVWFMVFGLSGLVVSCVHEDREQKRVEAQELKDWQNSPEHAFRFCITTAVGMNGTATPEQIHACNKAAGR